MVRAFQTVFDANLPTDQVDQCTGNKERRHAPRAFFLQQHGCISDRIQPTNARSDHHTRAETVVIALRYPTRISNRLVRRCNAVQNEIINFALFFGGHIRISVEIALSLAARHFAGVGRAKMAGVKFRDGAGTGLPVKQT